MNRQSPALFTPFSKDSLASLIKEVKETLAAGFNGPRQKTFAAADLWNIQRRGKRMIQRRLLF